LIGVSREVREGSCLGARAARKADVLAQPLMLQRSLRSDDVDYQAVIWIRFHLRHDQAPGAPIVTFGYRELKECEEPG
jgi:hypothetical protein